MNAIIAQIVNERLEKQTISTTSELVFTAAILICTVVLPNASEVSIFHRFFQEVAQHRHCLVGGGGVDVMVLLMPGPFEPAKTLLGLENMSKRVY